MLHSGHTEIICDTENHRVTYITVLCNRKVEQGVILRKTAKIAEAVESYYVHLPDGKLR